MYNHHAVQQVAAAEAAVALHRRRRHRSRSQHRRAACRKYADECVGTEASGMPIGGEVDERGNEIFRGRPGSSTRGVDATFDARAPVYRPSIGPPLRACRGCD